MSGKLEGVGVVATDESSYITGQTFLIDGGASIRNGGPARQVAR